MDGFLAKKTGTILKDLWSFFHRIDGFDAPAFALTRKVQAWKIPLKRRLGIP
jgi:hypothetical protein